VLRGRPALALVALLLAGLAAGCDGDDDGQEREPASPTPDRVEGELRVQTVAEGLEVPWEIVFLPDGDALITERPGRVRLLTPEGLRDEPVAQIGVSALGEGGLLGLALDPDFERNGYVYLYFTTATGMLVERGRYEDGLLKREATVLDGIAAGPIHDSGRIHFGPDRRLYVATGDAGDAPLAQDGSSLNGKFLRLDEAHYRGADAEPEIFTSGHRNPQGFDWQPGSGDLYASEHGEIGNDEVNLLREGSNYGWPEVEGSDHGDFTGPVALYEDTIAPSGATFVEEPGSAWTGDFLVAALAGEQLRRLRFRSGRPVIDEALFEGRFGRLRTVVEGPDGALYLLTSNRDGRGTPREGDDRVLRVVPPG
jgi:glucose/arabinose dehydrogenase